MKPVQMFFEDSVASDESVIQNLGSCLTTCQRGFFSLSFYFW